MARFTLPRDLYHGKGSIAELANLKGKKAIVVVGGGSMKRFGFLDKVVANLKAAGMEVELFENVSGKKYAAEGKVTVSVKLDDPYAPFLGPNQYVHYTQDTEAVKTSYALCEGMTDDREIFETIRGYIKANYMYDYVKAATVAGGTLPDIDGCY